MRKNRDTKRDKNLEIYCNACGKQLKTENQMELEGVFHGRVQWGYFSGKDGEVHTFDLCEECYDKWISGFCIPVEKTFENELL